MAPLDEAAVAAEAAHVGFLVLDYLVALLAANVPDAATPNQQVQKRSPGPVACGLVHWLNASCCLIETFVGLHAKVGCLPSQPMQASTAIRPASLTLGIHSQVPCPEARAGFAFDTSEARAGFAFDASERATGPLDASKCADSRP